jgi:hypothetical protein
MNIYNRCFDDQSQLRIRLETGAIEGIFELAESGEVELVWSFMLDYENGLNPQEDRKEWAELLSQIYLYITRNILLTIRPTARGERIRGNFGVRGLGDIFRGQHFPG